MAESLVPFSMTAKKEKNREELVKLLTRVC